LLHSFYWIALVLMMGTLTESSAAVIGVPMALYFFFWMGPDLLPDLVYVSPLLLTFSSEPDQLNPLSVSFMAGEPITTWLPLITTVIFSIIFIVVAMQRFNRQEF
jgi:hypothetical protein